MKSQRNPKKIKEVISIKKPCACDVHMRLEPNKPCIGHGIGCPCSDFISSHKLKEDSGQVDKKEEPTIQST